MAAPSRHYARRAPDGTIEVRVDSPKTYVVLELPGPRLLQKGGGWVRMAQVEAGRR